MTKPNSPDYVGEYGIYAVVEAPPEADVIFLSIDSAGTPGRLNKMVLESLGVETPLPTREELASGFAIKPTPRGLLCYIVTVTDMPTRDALSRNLRAALDQIDVSIASSYWIPLMGTGDGRLDLEASFQITLDALEGHEPVRSGRVLVVISLPPETSFEWQKIFSSQALEFGRLNIVDPESDWPAGPGSGLYGVPCNAAVLELLRLASTYAVIPDPRRENITTSLLFFALGESRTPVVELPLYGDDGRGVWISVRSDAWTSRKVGPSRSDPADGARSAERTQVASSDPV